MSSRQWFSLSQKLIEIQTLQQVSYKYKKLPLQYFFICLTAFSGPIALLYNKFLPNPPIKLTQNHDKSILIFNCKGDLMRIIPFQIKDRVILFKWTTLQQLVIIYASGDYVLIDSFTGKIQENTFFKQKINFTQRCVAALIDYRDTIYIMKQKQLGIVKSVRGSWSLLPSIKPNLQNPIISVQNLKRGAKSSSMNNSSSLVYLSNFNKIQQFNQSSNIQRVLFQNQYLLKNYKSLICLSKRESTLILVFKNPFKIMMITLAYNLKNPVIVQHDPMIQLKQPLEISKKKSKHIYMSLNDQIIWMGDSEIAAYNNGKILIIFDHKNMKAIYDSYELDNRKLVQEVDGFRLIGQQSQLYRQVNSIYQQLVSLQSLQQSQRLLFKQSEALVAKSLLKQKYLSAKRSQLQCSLTLQQKGLIIHELHQLYRKFINKQMISLSELNQLKVFAGYLLKEIVQNGAKCLNKLELIKIFKFATFVQNYFIFTSETPNQRQSQKRISQKVHQDQNQDKMFGNLSCFLQTPIYQLCAELRILNSLKYSYLKRILTIDELHYLKYEKKNDFIQLLLRYNMHLQLDLMFGDSVTKAKIFYHWSKCKIQRESSIQQVNETSTTLQSSDTFIYQTILQKYQCLKQKLNSNNQLFSQLAKYCVDRNKLTLGLKLLQNQNDQNRRILVGLLILVAKKDKSLLQKVLEFTQHSKNSYVVYKVIKQLLKQEWIQKHVWTNLFHNKRIVQEHYIKYNQFVLAYDHIRDYYLQNKMLIDLAYLGIKQTISEVAKLKYKTLDDNDTLINQMRKKPFDDNQNEQMKQRLIKQNQKLIPTTCLILKKHNPKVKLGLSLLQKFKAQVQPISQSDITSVQAKLNDKQLQYLGQIILQKGNNKQMAILAFSCIKSDKCYKILMKQNDFRKAADVAFDRKNLLMLRQIRQTICQIFQGSQLQVLSTYTFEKQHLLEKKGLK